MEGLFPLVAILQRGDALHRLKAAYKMRGAVEAYGGAYFLDFL